MSLLEIIAEDKYVINYRPKFTALTDSALAAILLQEMIHYWKLKDGGAFYKFRVQCKHTKYREGDSWCETLGFNKHEFDTALKVIGTKIVKGVSKADVLETKYPERKPYQTDKEYYAVFCKALAACVLYWTDSSRITWYLVNEKLLGKFVDRIYLDISQGRRYLKSSILAVSRKERASKKPISSKVCPKVPSNGSIKESSSKDDDSFSIPQPIEQSRNPEPPAPAPVNGSGVGEAPPENRDFQIVLAHFRAKHPSSATPPAKDQQTIKDDLRDYGRVQIQDMIEHCFSQKPDIVSYGYIHGSLENKWGKPKAKAAAALSDTTLSYVRNDPAAGLVVIEVHNAPPADDQREDVA